jgi:protein SCO1/2
VSGGFNNLILVASAEVNGRGRPFLQKLGCGAKYVGQPRAAVLTWPVLSVFAALVLAASAFAQNMSAGGIMGPPASAKPVGMDDVGIQQRLQQQIPLDLTFRDESGKTVQLGDYIGKKPVILNFVYYRCPMLCPELLIGLESSLKVLKFDVGKEFDVVTVSFDSNDTPQLAAAKKAEILKRYGRPGAENGWHFLTGQAQSITALAEAAGFKYHFDKKTGQFAHATAIMVLTSEGKLSQYYYGVDFSPKDLRLSLIQASDNKIGTVTDAVLLYCFHYDPATGKYSVLIGHVIQVGGGLTILLLGGMILLLSKRGPDHQLRRQGSSH